MSEIILKVKKSSSLPEGKVFDLVPGENTIGRNEQENRIVVPEGGVSRKHCVIVVDEKGGVFIEDLKSGNGTLVGGVKIRDKKPLKNRDTIKINDSLLEISIPEKNVAKPSSAVKPNPAPVQKKQDFAAKTKSVQAENKLFLMGKNIIFVFALVLICIFLFWFIFSKAAKPDIPGPADCRETYMLADTGCKFMYPEGWARLDKFEKQVFGLSYFERKVLLFGTKYKGQDVIFAVDVLEGIPPELSLDFLVKTGASQFPRMVPHAGRDEKDFETGQNASLCGKESFLGISPAFTNAATKSDIKTIEAFIRDGDRRILLVGFTNPFYFNQFMPVLKQMILSFSIEPRGVSISRPADVQSEIRQLTQSADTLVEKIHLKSDNLYNALKDYKRAVMLQNLYSFKPDDEKRIVLLEKFRKAQKIFDEKYDELKFQIERGLKIGEEETVFNAASEIVKMIPDQNDKRFQNADRYYSKYKDKYETRTGVFKY